MSECTHVEIRVNNRILPQLPSTLSFQIIYSLGRGSWTGSQQLSRSLFWTVDGMWLAALSSCHCAFLAIMDCDLEQWVEQILSPKLFFIRNFTTATENKLEQRVIVQRPGHCQPSTGQHRLAICFFHRLQVQNCIYIYLNIKGKKNQAK